MAAPALTAFAPGRTWPEESSLRFLDLHSHALHYPEGCPGYGRLDQIAASALRQSGGRLQLRDSPLIPHSEMAQRLAYHKRRIPADHSIGIDAHSIPA